MSNKNDGNLQVSVLSLSILTNRLTELQIEGELCRDVQIRKQNVAVIDPAAPRFHTHQFHKDEHTLLL